MTLTVDKQIEAFPHTNLSKIVGTPTYETIKILNEEISANAVTISNDSGGIYGYLALTIPAAIYSTVTATPFVAPHAPANPDLTGLTGPQISARNRQFDRNKATFNDYTSLQLALKKQLIAAVEPIYLRAIRDKYVGFGNLTILEMLTHLYSSYAKITPADLEKNDARMKAPYDANDPPELLIQQVQDGVDYAAHADCPYSPEQVVTIAYNLVNQTGIFDQDLKDWRARPGHTKTWPDFKVFFIERHQDWYQNRTGRAGQDYGRANMLHDEPTYDQRTIDAIANLATATASDRATVASLTATIEKLTSDLNDVQSKLVIALETNASLARALGDGKENQRGRGRAPKEDRRPPNRHYCWTHGYLCTHHSGECPSPATGHQIKAKSRDNKGGSTANRDKWIDIVTRTK